MPTREEIQAIYREGEEAVFILVEKLVMLNLALQERVKVLEDKVQKLEDQLKKDSHTSGLLDKYCKEIKQFACS